jgi:hypothetical protein
MGLVPVPAPEGIVDEIYGLGGDFVVKQVYVLCDMR